MKSAFECFQEAAKWQAMAMAAQYETDRRVLLEMAEHWRTLGNEAKAADKMAAAEGPREVPPRR